MAKKVATQAPMIRLRNVSTGETVERWPVDARGMLLSKEYVVATAGAPAAASITRLDGKALERGPDGLVAGEPAKTGDAIAPAAPDAPNVVGTLEPKAPTAAEQLDKWELKDLQTLAGRVDIDPTDKTRAQLVDLLSVDLPELVSAGVVTLEQLPELKITPEQFPNAAPAE